MDDGCYDPREPIVRSQGRTDSERYLSKLCGRTFLSLWSYPGLHRDQRGGGPNADGKELADLVVVFENDILLFSDKYCELPQAGDIEVGWKRWFRRAIQASAEQAWGAERWIRKHPDRLFLDSACTRRFPFEIPDASRARFHLITVAHGVSSVCSKVLGGSGSLMLRSDLRGFEAHSTPFTIGDLDPAKTFVHVFDDTSLDIVLGTLDTIADLTHYLRKKEELFRSKTAIFAAGEEELLAVFLKNIGPDGEHAFAFPPDKTGIALFEGLWTSFLANPQRRRQVEADRISYMWDGLIEQFNKHTLAGTQYRVSEGGARSTERIVRIMAREPRLRRRMLASGLGELLKKPESASRVVRVSAGQRPGDPYYVFLLLPIPEEMSYEEYRTARANLLELYCQVVKVKFPAALDIVGIATEPGIKNERRSEDAAYLDAREWTDENQSHALEVQRELGLLLNVREFRSRFKEYPDGDDAGLRRESIPPPGRNPRNKQCPCGSGQKYKKCHGA